MRALRCLQAEQFNIGIPVSDDPTTFTPGSVTTSTPNIQNLIPTENIKVEGHKPKRKLSALDEFTTVWKDAPKKKRGRASTSSVVAVQQSIGSPTRVLTKDATTEDLLKIQQTKILSMQHLDGLLKKTPSSTKTVSMNAFLKVRKRIISFVKMYII